MAYKWLILEGMSSAQDKNGANNRSHAVGKTPSKLPAQKPASRYSTGWLLRCISLTLVTLIVLTVAAISQRSERKLQEATQAVKLTRAVIEKLERISLGLSEVESSARSFAISDKQSNLKSFYIAAAEVPQQVDALKGLLQDDPAQLQSFAAVEPIIAEHLKAMKDMVDLGDKKIFRGSSQRELSDKANELMQQILAALKPMEKEQQARLTAQQTAAATEVEYASMLNLSVSIVSAVLVLAGGVWVLLVLRDRGKTEEKLDRLLNSMPDALLIINGDGKIIGTNAHAEKLFGYSYRELQGEKLAVLVPERFRPAQRQYYGEYFSQRGERAPMSIELCGVRKDGQEFPIEVSTKPLVADSGLVLTSAIRDITKRKRVEQQVSSLNQELERRAKELEAANKELQAFSYSVSHDLRSPLQNIDSFSQILMENYARRLNAEGQDYIQRIRACCQNMDDIIDALLVLANINRGELTMDRLDLTALAKEVASALEQKQPDRLVDWAIAEGLTAEGDGQLLRVVLENLFGNAWKFTVHRERARIEFGALPQSNDARAYFVRDNGAGFDMARVKNLFTPFKRLHDQTEFRGTGIGLATVQRVIHRHGGKIWAEGVVNSGATFCFTLTDKTGASNGEHHHLARRN